VGPTGREKTPRAPLKKILLLALATSRNEDALTFLLDLLETAPQPTAAGVLTTLAAANPAVRIRTAMHSALTRRADQSPWPPSTTPSHLTPIQN
jgi:hypothetical protein